jgi:hypothetical protein
MAFTSYTCIDDVIRKHRVRWVSGSVIGLATDAPRFGDYFRAELAFNQTALPPARSESGADKQLLFPIIREVWRTYHNQLSLFSHELLMFDADLTGFPDYFVCRQSEFGPFYPTPPYLIVIEAKLDDFAKAWGQCLAAMLAAQHLNGNPDQPVYGIATNGKSWEFGVLLGSTFTQDPGAFALNTLDTLGQALHAVFRACRDLALAHTTTAPANP